MRFGRRSEGADVHPDELVDHDAGAAVDERDADGPDDVEDTIRLDDLPWGRSGPAGPEQPPAPGHRAGAGRGSAAAATEPDDEPDPEPDPPPEPEPQVQAEPKPEPEPEPERDPEPRPDDVPATGTWAERDVAPQPTTPATPTAPATRPSTGATAAPTVAGSRRRFVRRRWARRWGVWRRVVLGLVVAALVLTGVWLVFFSSVLAVSGVQVTGTERLSGQAVRHAAAVPLGGPLATVDLDAVAARLQKVPAVKSVDVSRAWPDRVRVDVTERRAVAVVTSGGGLRGVDATGVVFDHYAKRPSGMPLVRRTSTTDRDALGEAATVAGSLPADLSRRVAYVSVATVDQISLGLRNGKTVRWGSAADSADKARVLEVLLDQKATAYDVSVPGQPVIRK